MLSSGLLAIALGVSYLVPSAAEVTTVEPIRQVLPPAVFASLWITAGALCIVLGPTKWWQLGLAAVAFMHGGWAAASLIAWFDNEAPRGWVLAGLYAHAAISCMTSTRMLNPPRKTEEATTGV